MEIALPYDFKPRRYQKRLMAYFNDGGKRAVGVWHRRAGKDLVMLNQTCVMAHERKGVYWHCLPTYRQAKKAIWDGFTSEGKRIIDTVFPPAIVKRKNEAEMLLELQCGSMFQLVGSDTIDHLVGAGPVHISFSEFSISKPNCWDLTRPMLRENRGSAAFIFTPRGNNHAKKLFDIAKESQGWYAERLTIHDTGALPLSTLEEERQAGMPEALIRQEYLCDFTAALVGSVYGDLIEALEKRGHIEAFEHDRDGVFVSFDLGIGDATALWFWRVEGGQFQLIDYHEASGKPASYFFDELELRAQRDGYRYTKIYLPHDARHRTFQTGVTTLDLFLERFGPGMVQITPHLSLADGLQAARWFLQQDVRIHLRCGEGIECLKQYHYAYDADARTYTKKPEHDWSSHGADAFRYAALVARAIQRIVTRPKPANKPAVPEFRKPTIDELFAAQGGGRNRI